MVRYYLYLVVKMAYQAQFKKLLLMKAKEELTNAEAPKRFEVGKESVPHWKSYSDPVFK